MLVEVQYAENTDPQFSLHFTRTFASWCAHALLARIAIFLSISLWKSAGTALCSRLSRHILGCLVRCANQDCPDPAMELVCPGPVVGIYPSAHLCSCRTRDSEYSCCCLCSASGLSSSARLPFTRIPATTRLSSSAWVWVSPSARIPTTKPTPLTLPRLPQNTI